MAAWVRQHSLGIASVAVALLLYVLRQVALLQGWDDTTGGWRSQVWLHGEGAWEFVQSAFLVIASKYLIERGSAESKE